MYQQPIRSTATAVDLDAENDCYQGTGGVSQGNASLSFVPAFMDYLSGEVEISRLQNGMPAPFHSLQGLPESWIAEKDDSGRVLKLRSTVVSGFVRLGRFFTRKQAAELVQQSL